MGGEDSVDNMLEEFYHRREQKNGQWLQENERPNFFKCVMLGQWFSEFIPYIRIN